MSTASVTLSDHILRRRDLTLGDKCVYGVIVSRIGTNSTCGPSAATIAADLGIGIRTVVRSIRHLEKVGMISTAMRRGQSNEYQLPMSQSHTTPVKMTDPPMSQSHTPPVTKADPPVIAIKKGTKTKNPWTTDDVVAIYSAYPRHVGRRVALKSIENALGRIRMSMGDEAAMWLLAQTEAYAAARQGQDQQYTPHPSTWYNQERYHDDADNWRPSDTKRPINTSLPSDMEDEIRRHEDAEALRRGAKELF